MRKNAVGFVWGIASAVAAVVAYLIVMAIGLEILSFTLNLPWLGDTWMLLVALAPVWLLPSRRISLPLPMQLSAEVTIAARPAAIWRWIYPNPAMTHSDPDVRRVAIDRDSAGEFLLHYYTPAGAGPQTHVKPRKLRVDVTDTYRQLSLHYPDATSGPVDSRALRKTDFLLEVVPAGTRLVVVQHLERIEIRQLWRLLTCNPARDLATRIKGQCEGTWMPERLGPVPGELGRSADFA